MRCVALRRVDSLRFALYPSHTILKDIQQDSRKPIIMIRIES